MAQRSKGSLGRGWRSAALTALALAIVACSHHNNNNGVATVTNTTNNTTTTNVVSGFGSGFATDFNAGPNTQPANVSTSDVVAVSNTTQATSLANIGN